MKTTTIVIFLGLALGACASDGGSIDRAAVTPTEHFAIEVQVQPQTLQLALHHGGVSPGQVEAVAGFAQRWTSAGGGDIVIQTPTQGVDPTASYRTATDARDILLGHGVPRAKVRIVGYETSGERPAPIILTYPQYQAKGPRCGHDWSNLAANSDNDAFDNFGCAVTANVAAQLANPGDLLSPRDLDPPDAARREEAIDNYRKGVATSSAKDEQANGAVSTAVH